MRLAIRSHRFPMTDSLRNYTERRLRFALSMAAGKVNAVTVVLSDINGPRGGRDKCCRVRVSARDRQVMVIDDVEDNLYLAIDRAADRAGRTLARNLGRSMTRKRQPGRRRAGAARPANAAEEAMPPGDREPS
ncbi:MAG: HPF/RaiA family ribosome-associated protein [Betaproteobacteria bacterium]|nr:HPF/RaiA family ribosome-associated protein [Betaproteobacteria bacterium]